jgi:hypothetical protein
MIRIERAALPDGLRALAYRDRDGNLIICVSEALHPASQRAAVIEAMRAARRGGWRAGLPPAVIALFLAGAALLRRAAAAMRARPTAWGTTAAATAAVAAVSAYLAVAGLHPGSPQAGQQPAPGVVAPSASPRGRPPALPGHPAHRSPGLASPVSAAHVAPGAAPGPGPAGRGGSPTGAPTPAPSPTPSQPPTPTPTPTPTGGGGGRLCITLLGVKVCLRV